MAGQGPQGTMLGEMQYKQMNWQGLRTGRNALCSVTYFNEMVSRDPLHSNFI